MVASPLAPAAGTAFAQSALYPGAVGLVADTGGEPVLLRETPSFDAAVLTSLSAGTPAAYSDAPVYSEDGVAWQPVSVAGMTGYVVAGYLIDGGQAGASPDVVELAQKAAPVEAAPVEAAPETAATETKAVEIRSRRITAGSGRVSQRGPGQSGHYRRSQPACCSLLADPVLTVIPAGAALVPTGEWSQGFVSVTYEGNYGWVDSGWVAAGEPDADTAPPAETKHVALLQGGGPRPGDGGGARADKGCHACRRPHRGARRERLCGGCRQPACRTVRKQRGLARPPSGRPGDGHRRAERRPGHQSGTTAPPATSAPISFPRSRQHRKQRPRPSAWRSRPRLPRHSLVAADPAVESSSGERAATALSNVNLRGAPETTAPVISTIPAGATLTALAGPEQGFYQVQYGQQIGLGLRRVSPGLGDRDPKIGPDSGPDSSPAQEGKVQGSAPGSQRRRLARVGSSGRSAAGQGTVMQGYHGSSHQNQDSLYQYEYSLDLARSLDGKHSRATDLLAGQWRRTLDRSRHRWHLDRHRQRPRGGHVPRHLRRRVGKRARRSRQEKVLGEISGPGGPGFMGSGARATSPSGGPTTTATGIATREPFTGQYTINGMDFPDTGGGDTYGGTQFSPWGRSRLVGKTRRDAGARHPTTPHFIGAARQERPAASRRGD